MQYAFILGRVFTLSIAEIIEVLKRREITFKVLALSHEAFVIETENQLEFEKLQRELGGTVKIVKIIDVIQKREQDSINFALQNYFKPSKLKKDYFKDYSGKKQFGVSIYLIDPTIKAFGDPRRLGMFIKKGLQAEGLSLRAVVPEFNALSLASVVVTKNLLLQKGAEIVAIGDKNKVFVGRTLIVQDFEDYGRRDYQRPVRDEKQGMIPPKVAQIMLNFTNLPAGKTILDPYAGIGTILQEGILLGFKMLGSDINKTAIEGAETNLEWFRNRYKVPNNKYKLEVADVAKVSETFKDDKIAAIVTEGSLGPIYGKMPLESEIKQNFAGLKDLWTSAFIEFKKILPKGAKVVICLPAYRKTERDYLLFPDIDFITKLGYSVEDHFPAPIKEASPFLKITGRNSMIYDRKDQIVAREILTFINN